MRGEYVELVPHERIVFSFGWDPTDGAPDVAPGSTLVEITLTADGDDTIMPCATPASPPPRATSTTPAGVTSSRCSPPPRAGLPTT